MFEYYKDKSGKYRWTFVAKNNRITGDGGQGYKTKWGVKRAIKRFIKLVSEAEIKEKV